MAQVLRLRHICTQLDVVGRSRTIEQHGVGLAGGRVTQTLCFRDQRSDTMVKDEVSERRITSLYVVDNGTYPRRTPMCRYHLPFDLPCNVDRARFLGTNVSTLRQCGYVPFELISRSRFFPSVLACFWQSPVPAFPYDLFCTYFQGQSASHGRANDAGNCQ